MAILNSVTENLPPYPMEELARIKSELIKENKEVFDFGTGDPRIPIESFIIDAIKNSLTTESGYPSIFGTTEVQEAQKNYLKNRFGILIDETFAMLPTRGSKEAVFHVALSLVGRSGKKRIIYPDPGYPVYESSTNFAGGIPTPVVLSKENDYLLKPWELSNEIIDSAAAIWINYPHNPTGKTVDREYLEKFINFCRDKDIIILSDDCYIDIYHSSFDNKDLENKKPPYVLEFGSKGIVSFLSLSKRSGLTGQRAGFMVGDASIISKLKTARSNMGLAQTAFICQGAAAAWNDEDHVTKRRKIFTERLDYASSELTRLNIEHIKPEATFYLWCKVPEKYKGNDIDFCLNLAKLGLITSPSSWLGKGSTGYFRLAMVPELDVTKKAFDVLEKFLNQ